MAWQVAGGAHGRESRVLAQLGAGAGAVLFAEPRQKAGCAGWATRRGYLRVLDGALMSEELEGTVHVEVDK